MNLDTALATLAADGVRNDRFDRIAWLATIAAAGFTTTRTVGTLTLATCEFCGDPDTPAIHRGRFVGEAAHLISQRVLKAHGAPISGNKPLTYHEALVRFACRDCNLTHGDYVDDPRG